MVDKIDDPSFRVAEAELLGTKRWAEQPDIATRAKASEEGSWVEMLASKSSLNRSADFPER